MREFIVLVCLLGSLLSVKAESNQINDIHAVLIAGSNTWENYRHQADVAHAFHVLKDHGVKESNIITMMYDDIANSDENPFPGKIFNAPKSNDVYKGVKIDYKGDDVNTQNFVSVLQGDAKSVTGGNGRVLESTKNDRVFIYLVDHGAPGFVSIVDSFLTAQQLNNTLQAMYDKQMFGELVLYFEACEVGSMFEGILPSNLNILAVTASNATEPSWGDYCDDPILNTCMGDLFSTNWLENSDAEDLTVESLKKQFNIVKRRTVESNVMKYGDEQILSEVVANFMGKSKPSRSKQLRAKRLQAEHTKKSVRWPSKDIPLLSLESRLKRTNDPTKRKELTSKLEEMKKNRAYLDAHTHSLIQRILQDKPEDVRQAVLSQKPKKIYDIACHHKALTAYHKECFSLGRNSYAANVAGPLSNLCALGIPAEKIVSAIEEHCAQPQTINIQ